MKRDKHPTDKSDGSNGTDCDSDLQELAGLPLADAVNVLHRKELAANFAMYSDVLKRDMQYKNESKESIIYNALDLWLKYEAFTKNVVIVSNPPYDIRQVGSEKTEDLSFRNSVLTYSIQKGISPLVKALELGLLSAEGQKEPVRSLTQVREPVPYGALEDRLWNLVSEKSRLEVLGKGGKVEVAFRRTHLARSLRPSQPPRAVPALIRAGCPDSEVKAAQQIEEVKQFMTREWDLQTTGSQKVAKQFSERHPEYALSQERLREIADECRGSPLPRGRPLGRKK